MILGIGLGGGLLELGGRAGVVLDHHRAEILERLGGRLGLGELAGGDLEGVAGGGGVGDCCAVSAGALARALASFATGSVGSASVVTLLSTTVVSAVVVLVVPPQPASKRERRTVSASANICLVMADLLDCAKRK